MDPIRNYRKLQLTIAVFPILADAVQVKKCQLLQPTCREIIDVPQAAVVWYSGKEAASNRGLLSFMFVPWISQPSGRHAPGDTMHGGDCCLPRSPLTQLSQECAAQPRAQ